MHTGDFLVAFIEHNSMTTGAEYQNVLRIISFQLAGGGTQEPVYETRISALFSPEKKHTPDLANVFVRLRHNRSCLSPLVRSPCEHISPNVGLWEGFNALVPDCLALTLAAGTVARLQPSRCFCIPQGLSTVSSTELSISSF